MCCKEMAHMILEWTSRLESGKPMLRVHSKGWQAGDPRELISQVKFKSILLKNSFLLKGGQSFCLFRL